MIDKRVTSPAEAVADIFDGATVLVGGFQKLSVFNLDFLRVHVGKFFFHLLQRHSPATIFISIGKVDFVPITKGCVS